MAIFGYSRVSTGQQTTKNQRLELEQAGYLINPQTNLKFFGSFIYRNFNPNTETESTFKSDTTWFSFGLRCDIFNWYFDY